MKSKTFYTSLKVKRVTRSKFKRKVITMRIDFLNVTIQVFTNCNVVQERNALRRKFPMLKPFNEADTGALHTCKYSEYPGRNWIFLPKNCLLSVANHEIQHAVDRITEYFGFKDTEFRAYLFEFISRKIFGFRTLD